LAGRRNAVEVRFVRRLDPEQHPDHVAFRDHVLDLVVAVREGATQIGARAGEALALRVGGEMREAAAPALVVWGEQLALDQRFVVGALQLLEAADHRLVALKESWSALRQRPRRSREREAGAQRAIEESATGQHRSPPMLFSPALLAPGRPTILHRVVCGKLSLPPERIDDAESGGDQPHAPA